MNAMKTLSAFLAVSALIVFAPGAASAYAPAEAHFANRPGDAHGSNQIEGWIDRIDVQKHELTIIDASGVERRIRVKQGMAGQFRMNDKVRVKTWPGSRLAKMIERL